MIKIYPKNKNKFLRLLRFGKVIIEICKKIGIMPIVYGGFAYFIYTKDNRINVNDLDFYISEKYFEEIDKILNKKKIKHKYDKKWRTIQVFKDDMKIELDSMEKWSEYGNKYRRPFKKFNFYGKNIKILNLKALTDVYKRATKMNTIEPKQNKKKYLALKKLK